MGLIRSGLTSLTPEDDEELTAYLWPIVREIIRTAMENGQSLIIEGCYIPARGSTIVYSISIFISSLIMI